MDEEQTKENWTQEENTHSNPALIEPKLYTKQV